MKRVILKGALLLFLISLADQMMAQVYVGRSGFARFKSEARDEDVIGKSNYLNGKISLDTKEVDFYIDLTTLKTGIDLRDEHMNENYLETHKYPFAEFFGKITSTFDPSKEGQQKVTAKGDFTVHGVTKPLEITGTVEKIENGILLKADWMILLENYNIPIPKVLHYRLSNEIQIFIEIEMEKRTT